MSPAVRYGGEDYNTLRNHWLAIVALYARRAAPFPPPPINGWLLWFEWREPDRMRDPDNVASGGRKLVIDGLVMAGFMPGDSPRYVASLVDTFVYGGGQRGVYVAARERMLLGVVGRPLWTVEIPFRMPSANEMRAAMELGVRRQLAAKWRRGERFDPRGRRGAMPRIGGGR